SSTMVELMNGDFSMAQLQAMKTAELVDYLQKLGRQRFKAPDKLAKVLKKSIRDSYRLGKVAQNSIDINLDVHMRVIRAIENEIKNSIRDSYRLGKVAQNSNDINLGVQMRVIRALEKENKGLGQAIKDIMETMSESKVLLSIPGIGPVFAAGIMAEIGSIDRFDHEAQLAKYAGLHWPKHRSGNHQREHTPMSKSGNRYLRYYLVQAANSVRHHIPEYTDYYNKKYNEVPKTQHKRALVLTARKFV